MMTPLKLCCVNSKVLGYPATKQEFKSLFKTKTRGFVKSSSIICELELEYVNLK